MRFIFMTLAFCLSCLSMAFAADDSVAQSSTSAEGNTSNVKMIPFSFADLASKLTPTVVNISSTQKIVDPQDFPEMPQFPEGSPFENFFDEFIQRRGSNVPSAPVSAMGSGFIIDAQNGYIVTNNHVVKDAEEITITLPDDTTVNATILGTDEKVDVAVLQIDPDGLNLTAANFGDSDNLRVGDWILAIGNPFGLGGSVTAGIVSARARDISTGPYDDYIQTDASINRGNSGGPLFNLKGEIIGINTAIFSPSGGSVGIGFAAPSSLVEPIINQIIKYGHTRRGWLGVRIQKVTKEIAESLDLEKPTGALVASINDQGPSKKAGIKAGDIILSIGEQKLREVKMLPRIIAEYDIGTKIKVEYWRENKKHTTEIVIGELEKAEESGLIETKTISDASGVEIEGLGIELKVLNDSSRNKYNISSDLTGLLISKINPMSEAYKKGLKEGEVIVEINQQALSEPQEMVDIVEKGRKNSRKSILLLINDRGNMRFVALRIEKQ